jgi:hypothetical protein
MYLTFLILQKVSSFFEPHLKRFQPLAAEFTIIYVYQSVFASESCAESQEFIERQFGLSAENRADLPNSLYNCSTKSGAQLLEDGTVYKCSALGYKQLLICKCLH